MTARLARLVLRLYPLAFQRRYGEEMHALLEQEPPRAPIDRPAILVISRMLQTPGQFG